MADKRNVSSDRKRVAVRQDYEVAYEAKKTGSSREEVKKAIKEAGNSRFNIDVELSKR